MSDGYLGIREGLGVDTEAVVLGGDLDLVGAVIHNRMIGAMVAEFELVGFAAKR